MLSTPKTAQPAATVGNLTARKVATNEQAQPLPYFAGRPPWLPLVWAQSNIYHVRSQAVTAKVGKSKQTTGYDYYGSLVGMLACCRLDYLEQIEVAGKVVWGGAIERDEAHPHHSGDIVVAGVGTFRVYWGTSDQPYDDLVLTGAGGSFAIADGGCGEPHPRYLDMAYVVVRDCYFGNNNATPPTIRILAERAAYFDGLDEQRSREGANPVTAICELIANPFYGLGLPDAIHTASAAALSTAVRRDTPVPIEGAPDYVAAMGYISPLIDRQQPLGTVVAQILEHFDGWLRPIDGQLYFGRFPHDGIVPEDLPELSYHDFIAGQRPRFAPTGDDELITEAVVTHVDREDNMEKASTPVPNPSARRRLGFANPRTFNRPWIVTTYQAFEQGNQLARHYSRDEEGCDVVVARERVVGLHAGDRFLLVDAPSESSQVVRIVERVDPAEGGEVRLQLVLERGLAPVAYVPPPNPRPILPSPELVAIVNARAFQLPTRFADYGPAPAVVLLAERPGAHVAGYKAYFSNAGLSFDQMTEDGRWALRGTLAGTVNATATTLTINASGFDLAHLASQSDAQQADDTLLLFIGYELCSIGAVTPIGGGQYTVEVLRGRRGSVGEAHTSTAELWIMPRAELQVLQHADFPREIASRFFRLASYTVNRDGGEEQDLADALEIELEFDDTEVEPPASLAAIGKAEAIFISWAYPEPPADSTIIATDLWIRATNTTPDPEADAPDHTLRATGFNLGGLAAGTTRYIWAQNRDTIGTRSTLVGPESAVAQAAPTGPAGPTGPTGAAGLDGPGVPFRGDFDDTKAYFYIAGLRRDAVYHSGQYWATANAAKNGLTTWDDPGTSGDWVSYGATYSAVATALLLAEDATITKTLTIGTEGANHGIIQSANYVTSGGSDGWQIKDDGSATFNAGLFRGTLDVGSGTSRFVASSSAVAFGNQTGKHWRAYYDSSGSTQVGLQFKDNTTLYGFIALHGGVMTVDGGSGSGSSGVIQSFALVGGTRVVSGSSSDPRTADAPLVTFGGARVEKSLDVKGTVYGRNGSTSEVAFAPRADDPDTGIYSDETDKVKIACGGSQVGRFVRSGGVNYLILESGAKFRLGQTAQAISGQTLTHYIEAEQDGGGTIKIGILT